MNGLIFFLKKKKTPFPFLFHLPDWIKCSRHLFFQLDLNNIAYWNRTQSCSHQSLVSWKGWIYKLFYSIYFPGIKLIMREYLLFCLYVGGNWQEVLSVKISHSIFCARMKAWCYSMCVCYFFGGLLKSLFLGIELLITYKATSAYKNKLLSYHISVSGDWRKTLYV